MNSTLTLAIAAAIFAAGTFLSTELCGEESPGDRSFSRAMARMGLCLGSGLAGAFAQARGWGPTQMLVAGTIVCCLAAASYAGHKDGRRTNYAAVTPLILVGVASVFAADWSSLLAGVLAAIPFGIGAYFYPRSAALTDTLLSAVAGLSLGLLPAVFVLFVAAAIVMGVLRARPTLNAKTIAFAPFIAGANLIAVVGVIALSQ